jgi:serine/threonine-protein kinase
MLLDVGRHEDVGPYIVMERLFGETLSHRVRATGPLPLEVSVDLMLQVLSALDAAHRAHVIHRDIKPSNIFVTGRAGMPPIAKVLDFGYARHIDPDHSRLTRPGVVVGTPFYLAPEVLRGAEGSPLSDIFAWGTVFFEVLTGRSPYRARNYPEYVAAVSRGKRRRLIDCHPKVPAALSILVDRTLSRAPARRPQSALELFRELRALAAQLPYSASFAFGASRSVDEPSFAWDDESTTGVSRKE